MAFAAVALTSAVGWAQDEEAPETFDLRALFERMEESEPADGHTLETHRTESQSTEMSVTMPDGSLRDRSTEKSEDARWVVRLDAPSEEGGDWARTIYVADWSKTVDGETDSSLTGAVLEIQGAEWSLRDPTHALSQMGVDWVLDELVEDEEDAEDSFTGESISTRMLPDHPVAVGDEWDLGAESLMESFMEKLDGKMTLASLTGRGRLLALHRDADGAPDAVDMEFHIEGVIESMHRDGTPMPVGEGAKILAHMKGGGSLVDGSNRMDATMSMNMTVEIMEGVEMVVAMSGEISRETVVGGEIPAPPEDEDAE